MLRRYISRRSWQTSITIVEEKYIKKRLLFDRAFQNTVKDLKTRYRPKGRKTEIGLIEKVDKGLGSWQECSKEEVAMQKERAILEAKKDDDAILKGNQRR